MNQKTPATPREEVANQLYPESTALASETTGLIPAPPQSDDEALSYEELDSIPVQRAQHKNTAPPDPKRLS